MSGGLTTLGRPAKLGGMKKIEARNLKLLVGGENILIAGHGMVLALWIIPETKNRYDQVIDALEELDNDHPFIDFFTVNLKEVSKPTLFANWYCIQDDGNEITHRTFSREEYKGLKESLTDKTVFKIT